MPDSKGKLTRAEMEAAIAQGQGVIVNGNRYSNVHELPTEADIAAASGDAATKAQTADDIDEQIKKLQAEKAKLSEKPEKPAQTDEGKPDDDKKK